LVGINLWSASILTSLFFSSYTALLILHLSFSLPMFAPSDFPTCH
jgi:hypothetical protein